MILGVIASVKIRPPSAIGYGGSASLEPLIASQSQLAEERCVLLFYQLLHKYINTHIYSQKEVLLQRANEILFGENISLTKNRRMPDMPEGTEVKPGDNLFSWLLKYREIFTGTRKERVDELVHFYATAAFTEMVNRYSNINPDAPTERLPHDRQTPMEYQSVWQLYRLASVCLDDIDCFIEKILGDGRRLSDGEPRYPDKVKELVKNCRNLVLEDRKRNITNVGEALRTLGY